MNITVPLMHYTGTVGATSLYTNPAPTSLAADYYTQSHVEGATLPAPRSSSDDSASQMKGTISQDVIDQISANHPRMTALDLANHKLSSFEGFDKLPKLKILDLSNNCFSQLRCVEQIRGVTELKLKGNNLPALHGIEHLQALVLLDISHNKIDNILELERLRGCPALKNLSVEGNPFMYRYFQATGDTSVDARMEVLVRVPSCEIIDDVMVGSKERSTAILRYAESLVTGGFPAAIGRPALKQLDTNPDAAVIGAGAVKFRPNAATDTHHSHDSAVGCRAGLPPYHPQNISSSNFAPSTIAPLPQPSGAVSGFMGAASRDTSALISRSLVMSTIQPPSSPAGGGGSFQPSAGQPVASSLQPGSQISSISSSPHKGGHVGMERENEIAVYRDGVATQQQNNSTATTQRSSLAVSYVNRQPPANETSFQHIAAEADKEAAMAELRETIRREENEARAAAVLLRMQQTPVSLYSWHGSAELTTAACQTDEAVVGDETSSPVSLSVHIVDASSYAAPTAEECGIQTEHEVADATVEAVPVAVMCRSYEAQTETPATAETCTTASSTTVHTTNAACQSDESLLSDFVNEERGDVAEKIGTFVAKFMENQVSGWVQDAGMKHEITVALFEAKLTRALQGMDKLRKQLRERDAARKTKLEDAEEELAVTLCEVRRLKQHTEEIQLKAKQLERLYAAEVEKTESLEREKAEMGEKMREMQSELNEVVKTHRAMRILAGAHPTSDGTESASSRVSGYISEARERDATGRHHSAENDACSDRRTTDTAAPPFHGSPGHWFYGHEGVRRVAHQMPSQIPPLQFGPAVQQSRSPLPPPAVGHGGSLLVESTPRPHESPYAPVYRSGISVDRPMVGANVHDPDALQRSATHTARSTDTAPSAAGLSPHTRNELLDVARRLLTRREGHGYV